jgi:hypothetical protein
MHPATAHIERFAEFDAPDEVHPAGRGAYERGRQSRILFRELGGPKAGAGFPLAVSQQDPRPI